MVKKENITQQIIIHHRFYIKGWDLFDYWVFIAVATLMIKLIWKYVL